VIRQLSIGSVPALKKNLQSASSTLFYPDSLHCIFTVPVKAREYNQNVNLPISLTEKIQIYWKLLSGSCKNWKKNIPAPGLFFLKIPTPGPALAPVSSEISDFTPCAHAQSDILHIKYA